MNRRVQLRRAKAPPTQEYLTRRWWSETLLGATWLGAASLEEYAVAWWMERNNIPYRYLQPYPGFKTRAFRVDFQIYRGPAPIVFEVQGDKWHAGLLEIAQDRVRMLYILRRAKPRPIWVDIWGHAITEYRGFATPTYAQFDAVMRAAALGQQKSTATGFR